MTQPLHLALQGGGSHGAFTWGVLDTLLADERLSIAAVSGTSAGAVNAVALAHGFATAAPGVPPREAARAALRHVWSEVSQLGRLSSLPSGLGLLGFPMESAFTQMVTGAMSSVMSPYQANPLDINPLRSLLEREIDFAAIARRTGRAGMPRVLISATHVATGRAVVFEGKRLSAQAVMASACLPMLFQAVEIDGEAYWDGGYSANPPLLPLLEGGMDRDLVLVQINPLQREAPPKSASDILARADELGFNASLLGQMQALALLNQVLARDGTPGVRLHRIGGGLALQEFTASSKLSADAGLIQALFERGQTAGRQWLSRHHADLGQRSSIDPVADYLGGRDALPDLGRAAQAPTLPSMPGAHTAVTAADGPMGTPSTAPVSVTAQATQAAPGTGAPATHPAHPARPARWWQHLARLWRRGQG